MDFSNTTDTILYKSLSDLKPKIKYLVKDLKVNTNDICILSSSNFLLESSALMEVDLNFKIQTSQFAKWKYNFIKENSNKLIEENIYRILDTCFSDKITSRRLSIFQLLLDNIQMDDIVMELLDSSNIHPVEIDNYKSYLELLEYLKNNNLIYKSQFAEEIYNILLNDEMLLLKYKQNYKYPFFIGIEVLNINDFKLLQLLYPNINYFESPNCSRDYLININSVYQKELINYLDT